MEPLHIPAGAVVVGVDGSTNADHAADWAADLAIAQGRDLVLLECVDPHTAAVAWMTQAGVDPEDFIEQNEAGAKALGERLLARVHLAHPTLDAISVQLPGDPRTVLLDVSKVASTVVVGSRGRGPIASLVLGSVSATVAAQASCPVVVVRPHHPGKVRQGVLVGTDAGDGSPVVLEFAFRRASELGLPLTVLHTVWNTLAVGAEPHRLTEEDVDFEAANLALSESLVGMIEKFPDVPVNRIVSRGTPAAGLLAAADRMHLVVVGHEHKSPLTRAFFGSVALDVLEHASTPVAVVPQP